MKSPSYAEMELIEVPEPHSCKPSPFVAWFNRGLDFLNQFLWQPGELQIKNKTNRQGMVCWIVYDPLSDRVLEFASETEVLIWLEKRAYRSPT